MEHIILLHGAIGAKDQLAGLAHSLESDQLKIHSINFSGHGGNEFTSSFSIELFGSDVLKYMAQAQLETASIFGYSMGGYVGMHLAKLFPSKIKKLVTLATKFNWNEEIAAAEIKMLNAEKIEQKIPAFAKQLAERHAPHDWKILLSKTSDLLLGLGKNNVLKTEDYASITVPSLLLLGDRDKMVTLEETVTVYKQLPNASFSILPNTPHPIEQVDIALLNFLLNRFVLT